MPQPFTGLYDLLAASAVRAPNRTAVVDPENGAITYANLDALSRRACDVLVARGIRPGDRVGLCLTKSIDAVAVLFGILRAGAAYVPIDPHGPPGRNAYILNDCGVSIAVVERRLADPLREELARLASAPPMLIVDGPGSGVALAEALARDQADRVAPAITAATVRPEDLAYILYTSGSTGSPKE